MRRQWRESLLSSRALGLEVLLEVLRLYRRLLRQWYMDLRVLLRYSGAAGSWGSWLCLLSGSAGLFIKALPSGPVKLALRFLFEKGDPDPFIPGERSPVSKEVKQLLLTPQPLIRLKHPRVMALQNAIAGRELDRRLGVSSGALEMGTGGELLLGSFAGVDRLLSSLLAAAGGREALTSAQELRHRIDTVMPLFLRILSMQADGTRGSLGKGLGRGKLKKKREQFLTFYRSLYPEALKADRQRIIAENRKRREAELIHRLKAATERFRFRLFTEEAELLHRLEIAEEQLGKTVERLSWNYDY